MIHWWALRGVMGTGRGCATVMAGLGGGERRSTVFGPLEGATDYTNTPKRERGRRVFSPSLGTPGRVAEGWSPARSSGDGRSEVVARSKACGFLASWSHEMTPGGAAKVPRGQGGSGVADGEKSGGGLLTCGDGFG